MLHQLLEAVGRGIGCHGGRPEGIDDELQGGGGDRDQAPLKRERQAEADCFFCDRRVKGQRLSVQPKVRIPAKGIQQGTAAGQQLGQHGRQGCSEDAQAECTDEQQIQPDVQQAGENQEIQRRTGISQGALHGGGIVVQGDQRHGGG